MATGTAKAALFAPRPAVKLCVKALEGRGSLREERRAVTGASREESRNTGEPRNGMPGASKPIRRYSLLRNSGRRRNPRRAATTRAPRALGGDLTVAPTMLRATGHPQGCEAGTQLR
jgi:hypothetical protein